MSWSFDISLRGVTWGLALGRIGLEPAHLHRTAFSEEMERWVRFDEET